MNYMKMRHFLMEILCLYKPAKRNINDKSKKCLFDEKCMGIQCFDHHCPYLSFTWVPNELCYAGEDGLVETMDNMIGLGGEMISGNSDMEQQEKEIWENICRNKIQEAYEEYMSRVKQR